MGSISPLPWVKPGRNAKHDVRDRHQAKDALSTIACLHNCSALSKCLADTIASMNTSFDAHELCDLAASSEQASASR